MNATTSLLLSIGISSVVGYLLGVILPFPINLIAAGIAGFSIGTYFASKVESY